MVEIRTGPDHGIQIKHCQLKNIISPEFKYTEI